MAIEIHQKIPRAILDIRLDAGLSASKDGAHPRNQLTNTLAAHDQIYFLFIFLKTILILAGDTSLLHGDDRNSVQLSYAADLATEPERRSRIIRDGTFVSAFVRARDSVFTAAPRYPLVSSAFFNDFANDSDFRKMSTKPHGPARNGLSVNIVKL